MAGLLPRSSGTPPFACYPRPVTRASETVVLPLFPLPNVVLFPATRVPLHVFEPRYRQMISRALEADRMIGMIAVRPEHLDGIAGDPELESIGCAGTISDVERLPDGRFNLVLVATRRFRVLRELARSDGRLYRLAEVAWLDEIAPHSGTDAPWSSLRRQVVDRFCGLVQRLAPRRASEITAESFDAIEDDALVNGLCQLLDVPTLEKQGLLEANGVRERASRLADVLDFHIAELECTRAEPSSTRH